MSAAPSPGAPAVKNYLVGSIILTVGNLILTLFTFGLTGFGVVVGIVAIVFGFLVNNRLQSGNQAGAADMSRLAKIFYWITLVIFAVGVVIGVILIIIFVIALLAGSS